MGKQVITIHGINTKGDWQDEIPETLGPHFKCISIKYPDYRWFGATKILIDPAILFFGVGLSIYIRYTGVSILLPLTGTVAVALLVSHLRRIRIVRKVKTELDAVISTGKAPHIIAHSFGTYLLGRIIELFPDIRVDHVVMTGCVLKKRTPWKTYLLRNPKAVRRIRNEMASGDLVPRLAVIFYGLFPGLGHAGVVGFSDLAHDVEPHSGCGIECTMLVHNVRLRNLGHSDVFVGRGHTQRFWLPFLWSLDPQDYEEFVEMCLLADECEKEGDHYRMGIVEDELRYRRWRWTNNFTLNDYLKEQIEFLLRQKGAQPLRRRVRQIQKSAAREMWRIVALAHEAQQIGNESGGVDLQRYLHPKIAAIFAVNAAEG